MSTQKKTKQNQADPEIQEVLDLYRDFGVTEAFLSDSSQKPEVSSVSFHENAGRLEALRRDEIGDCVRCKLHKGRKNIVFGEGNPSAELMLVGEAPGADEDIQGRPFVGRAGQLLMKMIQAIDYQREDVYIANILKCRPPGNRAPEPDEVRMCSPFLFEQISIIQPKAILALGTYAAQTLIGSKTSISRLRNRVYELPFGKVIATYHPSYLLRSPQKKPEAWEDLKLLRKTIQES